MVIVYRGKGKSVKLALDCEQWVPRDMVAIGFRKWELHLSLPPQKSVQFKVSIHIFTFFELMDEFSAHIFDPFSCSPSLSHTLAPYPYLSCVSVVCGGWGVADVDRVPHHRQRRKRQQRRGPAAAGVVRLCSRGGHFAF
jgi:hypothetical protein